MESASSLPFFPTESLTMDIRSNSNINNSSREKCRNDSQGNRVIRKTKFAKRPKVPSTTRTNKSSLYIASNTAKRDNLYSPRGRVVHDRQALIASQKIILNKGHLPSKNDIKHYRKEVDECSTPNILYQDISDEIFDIRVLETIRQRPDSSNKKENHMMNDITDPIDINKKPSPYPLFSNLKSRDLCGIPNSLSFM